VLKGEWGFKGLVVTDWGTIDDMVRRQNVFPNRQAAAIAAVKAGVDIAMVAPTFHDDVVKAVQSGLLNVSLVDEAVRRVLKVKFELGLFENKRVPKLSHVVAGTPEHRAVALRAAEESLILLKNNGLLPVSKTVKIIAVLGPNADHAQAQLGDWALGTGQAGRDEQPRELTVTALDGIRKVFPAAVVLHRRGAEVDPTEEANLSAALDVATIADLIVVVVGDRLQYYGESKSTATLDLMGSQIQLLRALVRLKKPFVVDLIASRPLVLPDDIVAGASAIIAQFSPGMLGGTALSEALVGKINPSGKLTISWPLHVGQLPVYYNRIPGQHGTHYADCPGTPRWAFGYGLSYSKFAYSGASINKLKFTKNENITVEFTVTNQGPYDGAEIVQVYISDLETSVTWPEQELKAFERVSLKAQEAKLVRITFKSSDCSIVVANGMRLVESGGFELRIGQSSDKILIRIQFMIT
jgi:beta-glucosidase